MLVCFDRIFAHGLVHGASLKKYTALPREDLQEGSAWTWVIQSRDDPGEKAEFPYRIVRPMKQMPCPLWPLPEEAE